MSAADILNAAVTARPEPATVILRGESYTMAEAHYVDLIHVALGNPIRTVRQQALLESLCEGITNVFCDWLQQARDSWTAKPCEGCARLLPKTSVSDRCSACDEDVWAS